MPRIRIIENTLSDGSKTYDVLMPEHTIATTSEGQAQAVADKLAEIINDFNLHDNDIDVAFDYTRRTV